MGGPEPCLLARARQWPAQGDDQENATPIRPSDRHTARQESWDCALGMINVNSCGMPDALGTSRLAPRSEKFRTTQLKAPPGNSMSADLNTRRRRAVRFSMSRVLSQLFLQIDKAVAESRGTIWGPNTEIVYFGLVGQSAELRYHLASLLLGKATVLPMIKGVTIAALVLAAASLADQQLSYGRYTDAALAMLRQIDHSFRR